MAVQEAGFYHVIGRRGPAESDAIGGVGGGGEKGGGIDILLIFTMPEVPAGVHESELSRCDRLPERRERQGHEIPCDSNLGERPGARVAPAAVK